MTLRGPNGAFTNPSPPASLLIITARHYSEVYEAGDNARADFAAPRPTDPEKVAAFDGSVANSGTYSVRGNVLTLQPVVAKRPRPASGYWTIPHQFTIHGDTLFTVDRGPAGSAPTEFRVTWVRVE
ncbi:MAG TPA: hypothetical protein VJ867_10280 [Gemmatimonadaceae bacterium]|nr:hypothetical protein [Gemmatimonadaceae bacterium]